MKGTVQQTSPYFGGCKNSLNSNYQILNKKFLKSFSRHKIRFEMNFGSITVCNPHAALWARITQGSQRQYLDHKVLETYNVVKTFCQTINALPQRILICIILPHPFSTINAGSKGHNSQKKDKFNFQGVPRIQHLGNQFWFFLDFRSKHQSKITVSQRGF